MAYGWRICAARFSSDPLLAAMIQSICLGTLPPSDTPVLGSAMGSPGQVLGRPPARSACFSGAMRRSRGFFRAKETRREAGFKIDIHGVSRRYCGCRDVKRT